MTIEVGQEAPDFTLRDQHKNEVTLSDYRGKSNVVVVFYPFAFSGVCESEVCALRDEFDDLAALDATVLAISCDSVHSHRVWAEQKGIEYPLLADFWPHGAVASAYGVFNDKLGSADRGTFIVDKAGKVVYTVRNEMTDARDVDEYKKVLADLG